MYPTGQPSTPAAPTPAPEPPEGQQSPWDAIAEEAWPGGPHTSKPQAPPPREPTDRNGTHGRGRGSGDWSDEDPSASTRPIYVWNPGASTETIQAVPDGENHQR